MFSKIWNGKWEIEEKLINSISLRIGKRKSRIADERNKNENICDSIYLPPFKNLLCDVQLSLWMICVK